MISKLMRNERGIMTIAELLMVVGLMAVVFGAIFDVLYFGEKRWLHTSQDTEARQNGRIAVSKIIKEIRETQSPSEDQYGISIADREELQFFADINSNPGPERIHYYLNGNKLIRGELNPTSTEEPWEYSGSEITSEVAKYIRNSTSSSVFRYYDKDGNELTNLPLSLTDRRKVSLVETIIIVDVDPNEMPKETEISSEGQLRNLRD